MAKRKHADTETAAEGLQASLQDVMDWMSDNARVVLIGSVALVVLGGGLAGAYEWRRATHLRAFSALAAVEQTFLLEMGATASDVIVTEPANSERASSAREKAIAGYEAVLEEYPESVAAQSATIRAAEAEIDLGRLDAAAARLAAASEWGADDPFKGAAERLRGYVLEEQGDPAGAGEAYANAGRSAGYPGRTQAFLSAGESFARAGETDRAIAAYREAIALDAEQAERSGAVKRLNELQAIR